MAIADLAAKNPFHTRRYPVIQRIVATEIDAKQSLADMVGERILVRILREELRAGARLKSTELADQLNVSRTPVAKALAKLAADGILTQPNNHQAVVSPGASEWLVQTHALRQVLEPEAASLAAGNISSEVLDDLWALSRDAKPTRKYDWTEAAKFFDFTLHLSIAEFCGNLPMKISIRKCWTYKRLSYELSKGCQQELKPEYEQHLKILAALAEGDKTRARNEMTNHLVRASQFRFSEHII